jgi:hypothetical protein
VHQILADRGFTLDDDITGAHSAELINPSFTKRKKTSRKISSVRIHIEIVIGLMKNRYTILKGPLPIIRTKSFRNEVEDYE